MSFAFTNEEDDDFGSLSNNSNLASIFHDPGVQQSSSKSLVYTAPKQPLSQKTAPSTTTNNTSQGVVVAAAITCYKLTNEKYEALPGKIGLALLGESESKTYQMILYQNKQKPLASVKITSEFAMISQPDNFCTFYDDLKQNWAVLFDSKDIAQKFIDEIDQIKSTLAGKNRAKEVPSGDKTDSRPLMSTHFENNLPSQQESTNKTKLISRIAKLGQPILPLSGAIVAAEESDSDQMPIAQSSPEELPEERIKPKKVARPIPAKPTVRHHPVDYSPNSTHLNSMVVPSNPYASMMSGQQAFPVMQFIPPQYSPASSGNSQQHFDTLMSENRMQNSEVRMHLCRLADKIDLLLQKTGTVVESHPKGSNNPPVQLDALTIDLHKLQGQSKENSSKLDLILSELSAAASRNRNEDSTTSVKEVERLLASERDAWAEKQQENHDVIVQLKQENERLSHRIEEISDREKNAHHVNRIQQEENYRLKNDVEISSATTLLTQLRDENTQLTRKLDETTRKEQDLAIRYRKSQEELECCETKCAEIDSLLLKFKSLTEEKDRQLALLQEQVEKHEMELSKARSLVEDYQKVAENETKNDDTVEEKVKMIMNKTYKEIMKQFSLNESYTLQSIKSIVSVVIRDVTLAALNGEPDVGEPTLQRAEENITVNDVTTETVTNEVDTVVDSTEENIASCDELADHQSENERKERSISFLETLHSSLAAASLQNEQAWKPDPPPPPLFDDFDNEDDWLA